jgi:shikimate dehydrogenase
VPAPRRAAVLGSPIAHSLSPALHRAAYAALGLDGWIYTAIECDEAGLPGLLASCDSADPGGRPPQTPPGGHDPGGRPPQTPPGGHDQGGRPPQTPPGGHDPGGRPPQTPPGGRWAGLSLTMPLKRAVLPLLDRTEPLAVEVGGANTVVFADGQRHGYNTDVPGLVAALAEAGVTAPPGATILGAGATACAALAALRATGLAAAVVQVRDQARAGHLLAAARRLGMTVELRPFGSQVRDGDLLISTVPAGSADFYAERAVDARARPSAVLDVVYYPWPTPLAAAAAQSDVIVVSGFDLLVHQAARQVELMTGLEPAPLAAMRAVGHSELARRAALATP